MTYIEEMKATQDGLIAHYKAVAKEAKAPIIMYGSSQPAERWEAFRETVATQSKKETDNYRWRSKKHPVISARWLRS